jgi:NADH:ubiquinone oxidoreductase subunit F (NADH-binding)
VFDAYLLPEPPVTSVTDWVARGGGQGLARALELGPEGTIEEILAAGLRGRGGAGFPTGVKWRSLRQGAQGDQCFVVCNGSEGEPGTFKDRTLLRHNPYQLIEGIVIAAHAIGAKRCYIGLKARFTGEMALLERALAEMVEAGLTNDMPIEIVPGPDSYLFGEETALLQTVQGEPAAPRLFAPYIQGIYATAPVIDWSAMVFDRMVQTYDLSSPTLVNNVETLSTATHILRNGAEWHRSMGTEGTPGHGICTIVGDVVRPGVQEVEMGTPFGEIIERVGGGLPEGRRIKAILSGISNPVMTEDFLDVPLGFDEFRARGSGIGSCGFMIYDDTTSAVEIAHICSRFLYVESCGQCNACKTGTGAVTELLEKIIRGEGELNDIETIGGRLLNVTDANRCFLPQQEQIVISSLLRTFPEDFLAAIDGEPVPIRGLPVPKLLDVADGVQVIDEHWELKRPDWTYSDVGVTTGIYRTE